MTGALAPGVTYLRVDETTELLRGMKAHHGITLSRGGRSVSRVDGRERRMEPGRLGLAQPGQVHCTVRREGPGSFLFVAFEAGVAEAAGLRGELATDEVEPGDPRAAPLRRLHDVVLAAERDRFAIDAAVAEAVAAFASFLGAPRPCASLGPSVRRAREFLLDHVAEDVTLDAVADHARADKYHLSRAFTRELGLPPYAFLTQARIARARTLLARGVAPSAVALQVGFCDQSQLHRHFRRIVGCTPGAYARR